MSSSHSEETILKLKATLAKRDFMSTHRTEIKRDGSQICFNIDSWSGEQDILIEKVIYHPNDPKGTIQGIEYVGWPRHEENLRSIGKGGRLLLYVNPLEIRANLVRAIENEHFKKIGMTEPLSTENNFVAIYFPENWVEQDPDYIDALFNSIRWIDEIPPAIIHDLKCFIACNCVARFKKEVDQHRDRIEDADFQRALKFLRQTHLNAVTSPFFAAALICQEKHEFLKARKLLEKILMSHWQYKDGRDLERTLFVQEFDEKFLKQKMFYEERISQLLVELRFEKLKSNGNTAYLKDFADTGYSDFVTNNAAENLSAYDAYDFTERYKQISLNLNQEPSLEGPSSSLRFSVDKNPLASNPAAQPDTLNTVNFLKNRDTAFYPHK